MKRQSLYKKNAIHSIQGASGNIKRFFMSTKMNGPFLIPMFVALDKLEKSRHMWLVKNTRGNRVLYHWNVLVYRSGLIYTW